MIAIGIDLGVNGAVAVLDGDSATVQSLPLLDDRTLDAVSLETLLRLAVRGLKRGDEVLLPYTPAMRHLIHYESVFRPNSLVRMQGEVASVCKLLDIEHDDVPVVTWKKKVLGVNSSDKQLVLDWCRTNYPNVSLRRSPRARTDSHDYADALALAHYAKGLLNATARDRN